jgi:hypothetical protein
VIDVSAVRLLLVAVTGWLDRREREALAYLIEESRLLRRQVGRRRLRLTDEFLTTDVWTWRGVVTFYTVFVMELASRRVQAPGSTPHPDDPFMNQVGRTLTIADGGMPVPALGRMALVD